MVTPGNPRPLRSFIPADRQVYRCPYCRCLLLERPEDWKAHLAEKHPQRKEGMSNDDDTSTTPTAR